MQNLFEFVETQKPFLFRLLDSKGFNKEALEVHSLTHVYNQFYYMWESVTGNGVPEDFYYKRDEFIAEINKWISNQEKTV